MTLSPPLFLGPSILGIRVPKHTSCEVFRQHRDSGERVHCDSNGDAQLNLACQR